MLRIETGVAAFLVGELFVIDTRLLHVSEHETQTLLARHETPPLGTVGPKLAPRDLLSALPLLSVLDADERTVKSTLSRSSDAAPQPKMRTRKRHLGKLCGHCDEQRRKLRRGKLIPLVRDDAVAVRRIGDRHGERRRIPQRRKNIRLNTKATGYFDHLFQTAPLRCVVSGTTMSASRSFW